MDVLVGFLTTSSVSTPKLHFHPIHPLWARGTIDGCALNLQVVCYFV
jgi:hypothetical protein